MKLLSPHRHWKLKQKLAKPSRFYGDGGTIHHSTDLDVEIHQGKVVAVWFRCQRLPFRQCAVDQTRAQEMQSPVRVELTGIEVLDSDRGHRVFSTRPFIR